MRKLCTYQPVRRRTRTGQSTQNFKYGDKQLDRTYGLDLYDFEARQYDAIVPMFTAIDPLAEKYYGISPYAYCAGDPVNLVDPTGLYPIYDWDTGKYYDSETKEEVSWDDAVSWAKDNGAQNLYSSSDCGSYALFALFYYNAGSVYLDHDSYMSKQISSHEYFDSNSSAMKDIAGKINNGESIGTGNYNLGYLSLFGKAKTFLSDGFHFATFDMFGGNVPFRSLGSFPYNWQLLGISRKQKFATIEITIVNQWTVASLTRNPLLGYSDTYKNWVDPLKNKYIPKITGHFSTQDQYVKFIKFINL